MATIYDIAKAAGVTATTVSYVLSGKGSISQATRERVLKCVDELGYRPNLIARSLIKGQTGTIGFVVSNVVNPFYAEMAEAVERAAYAAGRRAFVTNTYEDEKLGQALLEDLASRRVDGIIALPEGISFQALQSMVQSGLPVVCCLWEEEERMISPSVGVDFALGGRLVAEHLLALGHRRIGMVTHRATDGRMGDHLRVTGFRRVLEQAGCPLDPMYLRWGDSSLASGETAARELLALSTPPTAIFATNDLMATGVITAAWKLGINVPEALSVVGFDDILLASYTAPPLTTVLLDRNSLVKSAVSLLLQMIEGKEVTSPPLLKPVLVERSSTAPVSS